MRELTYRSVANYKHRRHRSALSRCLRRLRADLRDLASLLTLRARTALAPARALRMAALFAAWWSVSSSVTLPALPAPPMLGEEVRRG